MLPDSFSEEHFNHLSVAKDDLLCADLTEGTSIVRLTVHRQRNIEILKSNLNAELLVYMGVLTVA